MNIKNPCQRKHLFVQHQIDAFDAERISTMIRSDLLQVDDSSPGSLFGRSPRSRSDIHTQQHGHRSHNCIARTSQRGRERQIISSAVRNVNSNVTSSPLSRRVSLAQSQRFSSSSVSQEEYLRTGNEVNDDTMDSTLSALVDEIMSNMTGLSGSEKERGM